MEPLETLPLVIDNKPFVPTDAVVGTHFSTNTNADFINYVSASPADAKIAADSSWKAFQSWSQTSLRHRERILRKVAALLRENEAELVRVQVSETNCAEQWAKFNVHVSAEHCEEIAGRIPGVMMGEAPMLQTPGDTAVVKKLPIGPVLVIPPWNAALVLACRALHQPLAVGCTVVMKASEQCPKTHHALARIFHEAGLPAGVLNVIQCRREEAPATSEALIAHRNIRKIEFIGSAATGRHIAAMAGKHLKPALVELGGKSPALVLEGADLKLVAEACVRGGFQHNGQVCFSTERVIVHASVVDQLIPLLQAEAKKFPITHAVSYAGAKRAYRLLQDALSKGAELVYGEAKMIDEATLHPAIVKGATQDMEMWDEEIFGPVISLFVVNSDHEAIDLANDTRYGLTAAVYCQDVLRASDVADQLDAGAVMINSPHGTATAEASAPLVPFKGSGFGRQNGNHGLEEFIQLKSIITSNPGRVARGSSGSHWTNGA